ncbi:probable 28S rRNA (cytosine-C(5))-methyltransferase [Limulus polyphemus]|uniref:Probable 28S rRNA (Cytosine-C(5))-methyltransferase n=1 Tax=Limulus polyphemus TaxID=6850 RepID=A0ABM1BZ85_LIMPO|nr:probable 28S rRNA (cytosine-C(5))-methyltransferase [Limulus polyphemus]
MEEDSVVKKAHLSKNERVPRLYKQAARILKQIDEKKGSARGLVFTMKHCNKKKLYAVVSQTLKYKHILNKVFEHAQLFEKETRLDQFLALVLAYQHLIAGRKLSSQSKPVQMIIEYCPLLQKGFKKILRKANVKNVEDLVNNDLEKEGRVSLPRYVRINTINTSINNVIQQLESDGFVEVKLDHPVSLERYKSTILNLEKQQFLQDQDFPDVLILPHGTDLQNSSLYDNANIFLQDKSSSLAVRALNPPPGSFVLDACAAPGMKTVHLAALMENKGKILAVDMSSERLGTVKEMVHLAGVTSCETHCADFSSLDPAVEPFSSVEYILLDPSCSGSGIVNRLDYGSSETSAPSRIRKLAWFQKQLLSHSFTFPNVKRIVYSTCSINQEENEEVIKTVLETTKDFALEEIIPQWPTRGLPEFDFGSLCVRSYPEENLTNGFFVAAFQRIQPCIEELSEKCKKKKSKKEKKKST